MEFITTSLTQLTNTIWQTPALEPYKENILTFWPLGWQLALIVLTFLLAKSLKKHIENIDVSHFSRLAKWLVPIAQPITWFMLLISAVTLAKAAGISGPYLEICAIISTGWLALRALSMFGISPLVRRGVTVGIIGVMVLTLTEQTDVVITFLESAKLTVGDVTVSLWSVLKAIILLTVLVWGVMSASRIVDGYLQKTSHLTPSARTLISKMVNIGGIIIAFLVTLDIIGIELAAFAFFGGALGIGLGFGLQKIVSNFISGIILIMDKSIKPGDVISIGESYGQITKMQARYVVMRKRDGTEVLIPNESLMTSEVVNWSYNNRFVRQDIVVGVDYASDMEKVQEILLEVAKENTRVLDTPAPRAFIKEFGDSSVNFLLRVWMRDPEDGVTNLKGALNMGIWKAFKAEGIEIPFPQRVVHMITPEKGGDSTS